MADISTDAHICLKELFFFEVSQKRSAQRVVQLVVSRERPTQVHTHYRTCSGLLSVGSASTSVHLLEESNATLRHSANSTTKVVTGFRRRIIIFDSDDTHEDCERSTFGIRISGFSLKAAR